MSSHTGFAQAPRDPSRPVRLFLDSETLGLHTYVVLIQYAVEDGPVELVSVWDKTPRELMKLIEWFLEHEVVGFNLAFDWYHIVKIYNVVRHAPYMDLELIHQVQEIKEIEKSCPAKALCLKPKAATDLWLHALKGPFQSLMERDDIRIKAMPNVIAPELCALLEATLDLPDIFFARKSESDRWKSYPSLDEDGNERPDFSDIVLKFAPSSGLKALAKATGCAVEGRSNYADLHVEYDGLQEKGYRPWGGNWELYIEKAYTVWTYNEINRQYAVDDVVETRNLYDYFYEELQTTDDTDSELAILVANCRYKGYAVNMPKILALRAADAEKLKMFDRNFNSSEVARRYLLEVLDEAVIVPLLNEQGVLATDKETLEAIKKMQLSDLCENCLGDAEFCMVCHGVGLTPILGKDGKPQPHPAAKRAEEIEGYRRIKKRIELFDKVIDAERFHASFKVIGAKSGRMAGTDELNAQGISHSFDIRDCFDLADPNESLDGGDFDAYEVALMEAAYSDPELRKDLLTTRPCSKCNATGERPNKKTGLMEVCGECDGTKLEYVKIHGIFGSMLFDMTYDEILGTSKYEGDLNKYSRAKIGVFAQAYGGQVETLVQKTGAPKEAVEKAVRLWDSKYTVMADKKREIIDKFTPVYRAENTYSFWWKEPADYQENLLGFNRYFTLENEVLRALYAISNNLPDAWRHLPMKVKRRNREQAPTNAARSALLGAMLGIMASCQRAAANHIIQSTGAVITKRLQRGVWKFQPHGVHEFLVRPMQIHDELMNPTAPHLSRDVETFVANFIEEHKAVCPLLKMKWAVGMKSWASK